MKSKVVIIVSVLVVALLGGGFWWLGRPKKEVVSPSGSGIQETESLPSPAQTKLLTWNDQAGFSFLYPAGLKINKHEEDTTNYANLDFWLEGKEGGIKILAADTKYKSVAEWGAKETKNSPLGGGVEITLGGKSARKISFSQGEANEVVVGAVDEEILFTLALKTGSDEFWQKTFEQMISSFEFVYPTPEASSAGGQPSAVESGGEIIEEEEVIE